MESYKDIESVLKKNKTKLVQKYPIKSIAIFGSWARNEPAKDSDIDLLIEFDGQIGIQFIDLADEIESILGYKVDLVSRNAIKERYMKSIEDDLIYV